MKIAIYGSMAPGKISKEVAELVALLAARASRIEIAPAYHRRLGAEFSLPRVCGKAESPSPDTDLVISIGGDGTFLNAVRWQRGTGIPVAGLNGGHLGYLTGWMLADYRAFATDILSGNYLTDYREMLKVSLPEHVAVPDNFYPYALNEVAVLKESSASMISVRAETQNGYLATYEADGLICATPTGSTAYNLSAGGPIIEPHIPAWALSPVAPHSLNMRPLVVSSETMLRLDVESRTGHALLSLDGTSVSIPARDPGCDPAEPRGVLTIVRAPLRQPIVRPRESTFASTLRSKLLWGASPR